jgi:intraflagellar transport protein 52
MNQTLCGVWESDSVSELGAKRGRIVVIGSTEIFSDNYIEKEENSKLCDLIFSWLLNEIELDMTSDSSDAHLSDYAPVPHIESLSQNLKPCLQSMEDIPKDFTKLFDTNQYSFDTGMIPESIKLYKLMAVPHDPLTLIPPKFECPLPNLLLATFPPTMKDPNPPALDQFDLDEHFANETIRLSQLTNKCTNPEEDIEYYISESGEILGVTKELPFGERTSRHILLYIFQKIVNFKKVEVI